MVYKGNVFVSLKKKTQNEFLILPTNSIFGDYQILMNLKATESYTSDEKDDTYTMCMKRKIFKNLLKQFPDAEKYFQTRAQDRRIEFRRVSF